MCVRSDQPSGDMGHSLCSVKGSCDSVNLTSFKTFLRYLYKITEDMIFFLSPKKTWSVVVSVMVQFLRNSSQTH